MADAGQGTSAPSFHQALYELDGFRLQLALKDPSHQEVVSLIIDQAPIAASVKPGREEKEGEYEGR